MTHADPSSTRRASDAAGVPRRPAAGTDDRAGDSAPLDAFLRGVDRRADVRAGLLGAGGTVGVHPLLRTATGDDAERVQDLAARDGGAVPGGPLLLAEIGGELVAAIGLERRRVLADPGRDTFFAVDALQAAAAEHPRWPARLRRLRRALPRRRGSDGRASRPVLR